MFTSVKPPMQVFSLPQLLVVPLFQRPYVWKREEQWEPLWGDVRRLAHLYLDNPASQATHFLGAVVIQAAPQQHGSLQRGEIVDGQQRLTTLQLLLDACGAVFSRLELSDLAAQVEQLTHNQQHFVTDGVPLKLRHLNRDAAAFRQVMDYEPGSSPAATGSLIGGAHAYFVSEVGEWLSEVEDVATRGTRAQALVRALSYGLQLVVIDLQPDENSQEIFETLNARGTPLTASDLIKNFVFQRLSFEQADVEQAYASLWPFEDPFWEAEVSVGRSIRSRSSLFLGQWLVSRLREDLSTRTTFTRFKHYVEHETASTMVELLTEIKRQAADYRRWHEQAADPHAQPDAAAMCVYRTGAMQSEVLKPLLIWLHDARNGVEPSDRDAVIRWAESWVIRRALLRLTSSDLGRAMAGLLVELHTAGDDRLADVTASYLRGLSNASGYMPADSEVSEFLSTALVYRRYRRGTPRMLLEAAEDDLRGYSLPGLASRTGSRISRVGYPIEHVMPQRWSTNWPVSDALAKIRRDEHIHRLGNLTLLTESLNSSVSNGPWSAKRQALKKHDVLLLARSIREHEDDWDEVAIDARSAAIAASLLRTWPMPEGHTGIANVTEGELSSWRDSDLRELLAAGVLEPGHVLQGRGVGKDARATLEADGSLVVDGETFPYPSPAAKKALAGRTTNGWAFWHLADGRSLRTLWKQYLDRTGAPRDQ